MNKPKKYIKLTQKDIQTLVNKVKGKENAHVYFMIELYGFVLTKLGYSWDKVEKLNNHPKVCKQLWLHIADTIKSLDTADGFDAAWTWMNKGFGSDESVPMWMVRIDEFSVTLYPKP